ncbi:hypothetical protein [uncultured Aquimarina sp.]|uniref:hypothetical protein n=1 Tax=uncultured Aquimarina sp. TaxID=575652 RepID=UPI002611E2E4|nr:hypothetical protein [uncultured Aquimarina sp.]
MPDNIKEKLLHKHDLNIGSFYFYNNFLVSEIKEGITLSIENSSKLFELVKTYYGNKTPFFYIANRKNSYSFVPTGHYKFVELFPNGKGFAVVAYDSTSIRIAKFEKSFINAPTGIFSNLKEAIEWGKGLITPD